MVARKLIGKKPWKLSISQRKSVLCFIYGTVLTKFAKTLIELYKLHWKIFYIENTSCFFFLEPKKKKNKLLSLTYHTFDEFQPAAFESRTSCKHCPPQILVIRATRDDGWSSVLVKTTNTKHMIISK